MTLELLADVWLYPANEGGKTQPIISQYGCPLLTSTDTSKGGWDARMRLGDAPFEPGTKRRVGFAFLSGQGADAISKAGTFYLWEGRIIGEGTVVAGKDI